MELTNKNGMTYWTPVMDKDLGTITNFLKWEIGIWVFSNIYTTKFPHKATELIQYSHVIHTASLMYISDNVYMYDKEFKMHISHHPQRSWSTILQQAWNLRLREKLRLDTFSDRGKFKSKKICKRFNRGKCHNGVSCKYEHKCLECGKFGHGQHICRNKGDRCEPRWDSPVKTVDQHNSESNVNIAPSRNH